MAGASAFDYKYKKKAMPITMKTKSSVNIESIAVQVDPQLFFQTKEINDVFSYEL